MLIVYYTNQNLKYDFEESYSSEYYSGNTLLSQYSVFFFIFSIKTLFIIENTALQ